MQKKWFHVLESFFVYESIYKNIQIQYYAVLKLHPESENSFD